MNNNANQPNQRDLVNFNTDKLVYFDDVLLVYVKDFRKNGIDNTPLEMIAAGISGLQDIPLNKYTVEEWNQIIVELMVLLKQNFRRPIEVDEAISEIQEGGEKEHGENN